MMGFQATLFFLLIFLLAGLAGFSVRRGSICLVRATHEIISNKPAKTMLFVIEGMTIAIAVTIPAVLFFPDYIQLAPSYKISLSLFLGTMIYGVGAALNGGCALGTLNHLMNGNLNYFGTIAGIAAGLFLSFLIVNFWEIKSTVSANQAQGNILYLIPILVAAWIFIIIRTRKFLKKNIKKKIHEFITSPVARDFASVLGLGLASGLLYLILGHSWEYTHWIMISQKILLKGIPNSQEFILLSITCAGLIAGIIAATSLSRSFQFIGVQLKAFGQRFISGCFMGIGAGLIPGGNDTLILYGLPGLALHAPIGVLLIMSAIFLTLTLMKHYEN